VCRRYRLAPQGVAGSAKTSPFRQAGVFNAIAQLPEPLRLALAAVDVAGMSYADAAELLGVPVGTVMSRLHRGRSRWWPISCRGEAQARRLGDGRLQGSPRDYRCRTVRS
jgi:hypothetical protein